MFQLFFLYKLLDQKHVGYYTRVELYDMLEMMLGANVRYLSICLFVYLSICLFVYLFICLFVYLSICLFVNLSFPPSVNLSLRETCTFYQRNVDQSNMLRFPYFSFSVINIFCKCFK